MFQLATVIASMTLMLGLSCKPAAAASGQLYSCTLTYSVHAADGRFAEWGKWSSFFEDGPGKTLAAAQGTMIIDTRREAAEPVRQFGKPSVFEWKILQRAGGGNGWILFGQVRPEFQNRGGSIWPQLLRIADYDWSSEGAPAGGGGKIPITFNDGDALYTGTCSRS